MKFFFKNTKEDILMTDKDEGFKNNEICRFCEKSNISNKVRDHCHLTGKCRGPDYQKSNINVTQKQSIFFPFVFHKFSSYDYHLFL